MLKLLLGQRSNFKSEGETSLKKPLGNSLVFSIILLVSLSILSFISAGNNQPLLHAKFAWALVVASLGFCIYRHRSISKYRSILFILIAFFFFLEFKLFRFLSGAQPTLPPYCHIALAPTFLNFVYSQFLAITSGEWKVWGPMTLGFLWLLIMFTIGQGICSWVCFYGGWDEACSKLFRKPVVKLPISRRWRDFPLAFLIFLLVLSFLQGLPVFCNWFCPLKLTTAFWDSQLTIRIAQMAFFFLFLGAFVMILPALSKKRFFCPLICPFGALVSVCGKISPYRITIDQQKCTRCGKCFDVCPVFAINKQKTEAYTISSYCNRCGKCIDICPVDAINISLLNRITSIPLFKQAKWQIEVRDIFIFLSLLITGALSGSFVPRVVLQLLRIQ